MDSPTCFSGKSLSKGRRQFQTIYIYIYIFLFCGHLSLSMETNRWTVQESSCLCKTTSCINLRAYVGIYKWCVFPYFKIYNFTVVLNRLRTVRGHQYKSLIYILKWSCDIHYNLGLFPQFCTNLVKA
jgi:hypothetical protein